MGATFEKIKVTADFLNRNPNAFFVYGDSMKRSSQEGAAALRGHPRAMSFITKKTTQAGTDVCFKPDEYAKIFFDQLKQLREHIAKNPARKFYISKIGSGSGNKHYIWETLIHHNLVGDLGEFKNVVFCWEQESLVSKQYGKTGSSN
jgi:hypothetical protein